MATALRDPQLLASLEARNSAFTTLLGLIPARYYVAETPEEADSRWMKNKKRRTGEEIKEHKRRIKQDKLDPANLVDPNGAGGPVEAISVLPEPVAAGFTPLPPAASITDLRDRMRFKLDTFKRERGADEFDPQSRDALEAARRQRRGEIRDKRRKDRKEERRKARQEVTAKPAKTQLIVPALPRETDSISFPSLNLPSASRSGSGVPLKRLANPSQALAHLEKHNSKVASLPEEKRREVEEREMWAKAEERAAGGKVADEEKTLRKAVKREEKRKSKSGKEWSERKKQLEYSQAAGIKKKTDNVASRLEARRNKRLGIKDKSKSGPGGKGGYGKDGKGGKSGKGGKGGGKGRPGFEGKSQDKKKRSA